MSLEDAETVETPDTVTEPSAEDRAREQGWKPQDEYSKLPNADPKKWVDAETFLKNGEAKLPIVNAENRKLRAEMKEMRDLVKDVLANQKSDKERIIAETTAKLKAERRAAIEEADTKKVEAIDEQIDKLKDAPKTEDKRATTDKWEPTPELKDWTKANAWFNKGSKHYDPTMAGLAIGYLDMLLADPETSDLDESDMLKRATAEIRKRFPEKFQNPNRKNAPAVEGGNGGGPRGAAKKSFADLPAEAQTICDRLVRQKVLKSRDEYIANYQW